MKKVFSTLLVLLTFVSSLTALPGFKSFIADQSGEFVYYKDSSFNRESYIGLLCYDNETFQIRYYAPKNADNPSEKVVAALFTIDSSKENFEMTGENVIIADYANPEDVEIINYMHDLLYEFSKRRINLDSLTPETEDYKNLVSLKENGLTVSSDYAQFGGDVYIVYDVLIPFFNIKRIEDSKGNAIFECVRIGKISSAEETTFDKYSPVPEIGKVKVNAGSKKKSEAVNYTLDNQTITLDKQWEKKSNNIFVLQDDAIITLATYSKPVNEVPEYFMEYYLIRSLLESKDGYFIDFNKVDVIFDKGAIRIYSENYIPESSKVFYGIKYLTLNAEKDYDFMSFAATKANYLLKRSYYDKIIKSYSN